MSSRPVVAGESQAEWQRFRAGVWESLSPVGTLEEEFADRVALGLWRRRRLDRFETAILESEHEQVEHNLALYRRVCGPRAGGDQFGFAEMELEDLAALVEEMSDRIEFLIEFGDLEDDAVVSEADAFGVLLVYAAEGDLDVETYPWPGVGESGEEEGWTAGRVRLAITMLAQGHDVHAFKVRCINRFGEEVSRAREHLALGTQHRARLLAEKHRTR
jgi:hypothetical protein